MPGSGPFDSCATILSGLAKRLGLQSRLVELRLQHHWHDIVGEPIASHTWPAQIRFKKLYLIVQNSVWLQQLTFLKPALLTTVNADAKTEFITDIVFRVGEIPPSTETAVASPVTDRKSSLTQVATNEAAQYTTALQDPSLRELFTEVILRYPPQDPRQAARDPSRDP